jgi:hypothetical protein
MMMAFYVWQKAAKETTRREFWIFALKEKENNNKHKSCVVVVVYIPEV